MKFTKIIPVVPLLVSSTLCIPHILRSSRRSNPPSAYAVIEARYITIGDFTPAISGFTAGAQGGGPAATFTGASLITSTPVDIDRPRRTGSSNKVTPVNPWDAACPIPATFTINNFVFVSGKGGDVSFIITYGNETYTCPQEGTQTLRNGIYDMRCDMEGRVKVQSNGFSWINISQEFPCPAVGSGGMIRASSNATRFGDELFCDTDDADVQTCLQLDPNIVVPVLKYERGS